MSNAIAKLVPPGSVPAQDADAVLELAYLAAAADGRLDGKELEAYRALVRQVRGVDQVSGPDLDALLDRFAGNVDHEEIDARIRAIAPKVPAALRETIFKVVVGMSLVDLDASREEEAVEDVMLEALGIDSERVDALTAEVYAAFDVGSD